MPEIDRGLVMLRGAPTVDQPILSGLSFFDADEGPSDDGVYDLGDTRYQSLRSIEQVVATNIETGEQFFDESDFYETHSIRVPPGTYRLQLTETGQWWLARSDEGQLINESLGFWNPSELSDVRQGDFDGDGIVDFAGRNDAGELVVVTNADGQFTAATWGVASIWPEWEEEIN